MPRYTYGRTIPDAGSIQDLLERRGLIAGRTAREVGDAQARATYARGQSIGDLIGGLGQLAGQTLTQYADYKAGEPARQLEAAGKIADIEAKAAQAEENRAQAAAAQATSARQTEDADRLTRRETAWLAMFDKYPNGAPPEVLQRETLKIWGPKDGATMLTGLKALSELQQGQVADARDAVLRLTLAYEKGSPAMQAMAWPQIRQSVITAGLGTAETLPEAPPDKTFIAGIKAWASGKEVPSTLQNVPAGSSVIDTANPGAGAVFTAPAADRPEPNPTEASLAAAAAAGDQNAAKALDLLRQQRAAGQQERAGYFTQTPVYDAQGRPIGAMKLNARTGEMEFVSPETMGGVTARPPGNLAERAVVTEASQDAFVRLKQMFDAGAKEDVGPGEGRARRTLQTLPGGISVMEWLGADTNRFAQFEAATSAVQNEIIKAITGAQMSEPEAARIMRQIPKSTDHPTVWLANYEQSLKNMEALQRRIAQGARGGPAVPTVDPTDALLDELLRGGQ